MITKNVRVYVEFYKKNTKWYSNATIYRQKKIGDWPEVFETIRENFKKEFEK